MKYPKKLEIGDTISFVAPSFGAAVDPYYSRLKSAEKKWKRLGYNVILENNALLAQLPYLSNTPELIAKELMEAYSHSDCLISVGGGEMQLETLPFIDFVKLKESEPKWFVGFSDNTNFIFPLLTVSDTASIYGPCAGSFGMYKWHPCIHDCYSLLTGSNYELSGYEKYESKKSQYQKMHYLAGYNLNKPKILRRIPDSDSSFSGRLIGGCLDVLLCHIGTKYDNTLNFLERYKDDGYIWALDACDLSVLSIRRALFQLREAGWFKYAKGFLIGRPLAAFDECAFGIDRFSALEPISEIGVPIIADFDFGHMNPSMPLIMGSVAKVTTRDNDVFVKMELK